MFSAALKSGAAAAPVDPDFDYVTMLLHGDGTNGAQNNTFLDSSTNNFTITRNGNTTQGSFSPYGPNWSNYFDGNGDYLNNGSANAVNVGTGDFTFECWIYRTTSGSEVNLICSAENSGFQVGLRSTDWGFCFRGIAWRVTSSTMPAVNAWSHLAVTRASGTIYLFLNGTLLTSGANSDNCDKNGFFIGTLTPSEYFYTGYISNLRVVKGTALYTSSFTPSTTPLTAVSGTSLLTCADNRFIDDSTNNFTITRNGDVSVQRFSPFAPTAAYSTATIGGSGYFDGSGDWLNYTGSTISTSVDFTFSIWFYHLGTMSGNKGIFCASNARFGMLAEGGNNFYILASTDINTSTPIPINQWNHLAITRTSGTLRAFLNGTQVGGTASNSQSLDSFRIGSNQGGEIISNCYMSDARVLIGTGGTSVSVPTAPQTAITNTNFLCNFTNGAIFDNAMMNDLETVGNAQISTSVVKFGTGSLYFDGTGDYLTAPSNINLAFGTGDFTAECWVYLTTNASLQSIFNINQFNTGILVRYDNSSNGYALFLGGTQYNSSVTTVGQWVHLAATRASGTVRFFVNGTQTNSASNTYNVTGATFVAGTAAHSLSETMTGYIDDLRITKGVARYTANFTPPTAAFPDR